MISSISSFEIISVVREQLKKQLEQAKILMLPDPLTNFEIQKYSQNEPKFNGV